MMMLILVQLHYKEEVGIMAFVDIFYKCLIIL